MSALDRKLWRDLWGMRSQVLAIAMVVASGLAVMVMSTATLSSLKETADAYYDRYRFADVFAGLKRAPAALERRLAGIPGVQTVDTRIVELAILSVAGFDEPVIGRLVSVPEGGEAALNRLHIVAGRAIQPDEPDAVVVAEPFAEAHGLAPGEFLSAVMNGKQRRLRIVGVALSPEFVYALGPGALLPDNKRFGVLWLGRQSLAAAYDLENAFNSVTFSLLRGVDAAGVIDRIDRLLDRYGGSGAVARADQLSNWFLSNELEQLRTMATLLPGIFLAVAAFLTNAVLRRLITIERTSIGLLKSFGYTQWEIGLHYAKMAAAITMLGILIGLGLGVVLGRYYTELYSEFYRFPFLLFRPDPADFLTAAGISLGAAMLGAMSAVRGAVRLAPAEAIRPAGPPRFQASLLAALPLPLWLDQPTRIILRQILRWPVRSALSSVGISLAIGVLVLALQWLDAIDHMVQTVFRHEQHQSMTIGLTEAAGPQVVQEFRRLPGVLAVEPVRSVAADFRFGNRSHRGSLEGLAGDAWLHPIRDISGALYPVPPDGLMISETLAGKLGVGPGDRIEIHVLEGRRAVVGKSVAGLFDTYIGLPAYISINAMNDLMGEGPRIGAVNLLVDPAAEKTLFRTLKEMPSVSAVTVKRAAVDAFYETIARTVLTFIGFFSIFAAVLGIGVVYNSARIALSERGRELATLRVLGFSRAEISYILLGEIGLLTILAIPLGCLAGYGLSKLMAAAFRTELYRIPLVVQPATYGAAVLVILAAAVLSAAIVRRRVNRLDLIAVLKTRE